MKEVISETKIARCMEPLSFNIRKWKFTSKYILLNRISTTALNQLLTTTGSPHFLMHKKMQDFQEPARLDLGCLDGKVLIWCPGRRKKILIVIWGLIKRFEYLFLLLQSL